jgi:hypothetical protein
MEAVSWKAVAGAAMSALIVIVGAVVGAASWVRSEVSGLSSDLRAEIVRVDQKHDAHRLTIWSEINSMKADRVKTAGIVGGLRRGQELILRALERMEASK